MMRVEKYETYDFQPLVRVGRVPRYAKKVRNYDIDVFANRLWTQPNSRDGIIVESCFPPIFINPLIST
jgi:hypothetical protein